MSNNPILSVFRSTVIWNLGVAQTPWELYDPGNWLDKESGNGIQVRSVTQHEPRDSSPDENPYKGNGNSSVQC